MNVCVCNHVTDSKITELLELGLNFEQIVMATKATTICGTCRSAVLLLESKFNLNKNSSQA